MLLKTLDWIALTLLIINGINIGVVGVYNYDLIIYIFSEHLLVAHTLFIIMGIAAMYLLYRIKQLLDSLRVAK